MYLVDDLALLGWILWRRGVCLLEYPYSSVPAFHYRIISLKLIVPEEMGFSVTCVILGGQTLANINNQLPLTVGIIIVAVRIQFT